MRLFSRTASRTGDGLVPCRAHLHLLVSCRLCLHPFAVVASAVSIGKQRFLHVLGRLPGDVLAAVVTDAFYESHLRSKYEPVICAVA